MRSPLSVLVISAAVALCGVGVLVASPAYAQCNKLWEADGTWTEQICEENTSNEIGIGTLTPSAALHITIGDAKLSGGDRNLSLWNGTKALWLRQDGGSSFLTNKANFLGSGSTANGYLFLGGSGGVALQYGDLGAVGSTGLVLNTSGNVGIGTSTPGNKLHVKSLAGSSAKLIVDTTDSDSSTAFSGVELYEAGSLRWSISNAANSMGGVYEVDSLIIGAGGVGNHMAITWGGNVGIGTMLPSYDLQLASNSAAKPTSIYWTMVSDRRLKKNIRPLTGALSEIVKLRPVEFEWINPGEHGHVEGVAGGFIAQEVEEAFPDWIDNTGAAWGDDKQLIPEGETIKAISLPTRYDALIVQSIKELKEENDYLKQEVFDLKVIVCTDHPQAEICNQ